MAQSKRDSQILITTERLQTPESLLEQKPTPVLLVEMRSEVCVAAVINLSDCSKLQKLVGVVAWVRGFVDNLKAALRQNENTRQKRKLEVRELNEAELELIKSAQDKLKKDQFRTTGK